MDLLVAACVLLMSDLQLYEADMESTVLALLTRPPSRLTTRRPVGVFSSLLSKCTVTTLFPVLGCLVAVKTLPTVKVKCLDYSVFPTERRPYPCCPKGDDEHPAWARLCRRSR